MAVIDRGKVIAATGFRFTGGAAGAIGCIAAVAAFGFALSWIFAFVALTVRGAADAARSPALFGTPASLGAAAAWIGGLLAVFIPLSVWRYRRMS
jgi:hypothetical protein